MLAMLGLFLSAHAQEKPHPNIVVILVDDMGYGDAGCYNPKSKIPTPNIDRLAADGMRFTDAHAPGSVCHPSRYGLLTGRFPLRTDTSKWSTQPLIHEGQLTIASLLREADYATAMVGKWHLGFTEDGYDKPLSGGPVDCGFQQFFGIRASTDIPPYFYIRGNRAVHPPTAHIAANQSDGWSPIQGAFWREGGISPDLKLIEVLPRFTDEAISMIQKRDTAKPLMLYLAYPAPHTPWLPGPEFVGKSGAGMYGDFMMMVDHEIGRVLAALDAAGMAKETLLVFASDNGPTWYPEDVKRFSHDSAGGLRGMKGDAWEAGHRVPFIVRWPSKVAAGSTSSQTICFTDLLATLSVITNTKLPEGVVLDSVSFLPALEGKTYLRPPIVMELANGLMAIRSGPWKLINGLGSGGFSKPSTIKPSPGDPAGQLYHLVDDPAETINLFAQQPEIVKRLQVEMRDVITAEKPNIIFIMADDLGWKDVGYAGADFFETPHIDQLARQGMIFESAYSGGPNCAPTRACLMSGTYTPRHTIYQPGGLSKGDIKRMKLLVPARGKRSPELIEKAASQFPVATVLDPKFVCIPEVLKPAGYTTARLGKWHLGPDTQGFDLSTSDGKGEMKDNFYGDIDVAESLTDRAVAYIEENRDKPFFLYLSHWDVHEPIRARDEVVKKYQKKLAAIPENERRNFDPVYAAMIEAVDTSVGRVVAKVDELGLGGKTLIIFTSDNGGISHVSQLDPLRGEKGSLFEAGVRIPCVMRWRGKIQPESKCTTPITSVDFLPTFASLADAALPSNQAVDGTDVSPLLSGSKIPDRSIFWHYPLYLEGQGIKVKLPDGSVCSWRGFPSTSMRRGDFKLIEFHEDNSAVLYNLKDDTSEQKDLSKTMPEIFEKLRVELDTWQAETKAPIPSMPNPDYMKVAQ